ncbi:MAG: hypothetical protein HPY60_07910 [Candidatus Methanofastidiosum sp.]|nr:hypothetical protein [Methanofastidiosum sp.]NYT13353.1 hypothetical protein [Candidatus Methanofastidiosa archaeon]
MRDIKWQLKWAIILIFLSASVYIFHYFIFRDVHHIFLYLIGDIAFVFIEVLMVTLVIHELLTIRDKKAMLEKMNMVVGTFFVEMGRTLLDRLNDFDKNFDEVKENFIDIGKWSKKDFIDKLEIAKSIHYEIDMEKADLEILKKFLLEKREFMLRLLENPNLLEHDSFTELLWAVTHLTEELSLRDDLKKCTGTDLNHLQGDMKRAYVILIYEWIEYMGHLKNKYPYLFSLAVRMNPFNPEASIEIKE